MFRFVGHKMKKVIEEIGPDNVLCVVLDGGHDWSSTEEMIQDFFPWISFLHCLSHEVSLIIRDCFKEDGGIPELFELNEWLTDAQHWFSTHACSSFLKDQAQPSEKKSFVWPAVTRYCGVLLKIKRFYDMKSLLRRVVQSGVYEEKNFVNDPFPAKILGAERCVGTYGACHQNLGPPSAFVSSRRRPKTCHFEVVRDTVVRPQTDGGVSSRRRRGLGGSQDLQCVLDSVARNAK